MTIPRFRAIIPAGGAGTRLWPLSRRSSPKFLTDVTGSGRSLLQATWDRLSPLTGPHGIVVVAGQAHNEAIAQQLPADCEIFTEPAGRDSMAAIGLAAAVLYQREGDVVVGSFAADHLIPDATAFAQSVSQAVAAAQAGFVVTLGMRPSRPATGFGYIRVGNSLQGVAGADGLAGAFLATAFKEKPDAATASAYLQTGNYRWNAGMFISRAKVLLDALARFCPDLHAGLIEIAAAWDTPQRQAVLAERWLSLPRIAIDHAIAEPLASQNGVAVVPAEFAWDDVGDWHSVAGLVEPQADNVRRLGQAGPVWAEQADGLLVASTTGRPVAVVGIPDAVVVDTGDALLVTTRQAAQQVKTVVDRIAVDHSQLL
ncbi:MAG: mannose-1-phosphate guanylyltransferase [Bifidobacteriaceae bacterium]|jgi:mannose-1-phosphate guanylyltransferase|nr:mannose-1-phosphate guanylyltransferase [Bifidobacteriaceae bacterium]